MEKETLINGKTATDANLLLPAVLSAKVGDKADCPALIVDRKNFRCKCPICGTITTKYGRAFGFMKAAAGRHVYACYENELKKVGLMVGGMNTIVKWEKKPKREKYIVSNPRCL